MKIFILRTYLFELCFIIMSLSSAGFGDITGKNKQCDYSICHVVIMDMDNICYRQIKPGYEGLSYSAPQIQTKI